ncbi:hypothetical protein Tco_1087547 [Tanacetum coccineum]
MLIKIMAAKLTAASASEGLFFDFLSEIEPKKVSEALKHLGWVDAMQEELNQFYRTKMEAIRILFAFATYMNFKVYQMDVKSAFLNALYGLKQAPRAWYETLPTFLIQNKFTMGRIDNTLFIYKSKGDVLLVQNSPTSLDCKSSRMTKEFPFAKNSTLGTYLRNISDSSSVKTPMVPSNNLGPDLAGKPVNETSYKGMIWSLMYLTATPDIKFSTVLCVRYQSNPKELHLTAVKRILKYLKCTPTLNLYYPKCSGFDLKGYSDLDYVGCNMDRKITSGVCQILGGKLQSVAMSSAESEYVVVAGCCASILWMKSQLSDYDIHYKMVPIFCDNTSAIAISNNPVLHSRTKHIDIRYHFIRDHILKGDIELHFIPTKYQLADIFTKPLDEPTFTRMKAELGMLNID